MAGDLSEGAFDTDKGEMFLSSYRKYFAPIQSKNINILELGVHRGGSLQMWRDYFPAATIVGVDINTPLDLGERITVFQGSQDDSSLFDEIRNKTGIEKFDIIIDDAAHVGRLSWQSFLILYDTFLVSGGIYVVEDWGTGYLGDWPDGKPYQSSSLSEPKDGGQFVTHLAGMVGFAKTLVDCAGFRDIRAMNPNATPPFEAASVEFFPGQIFVRKP